MDFDLNLHFFLRGYIQHVSPNYFADTDDSGITCQLDMSPEALGQACGFVAVGRCEEWR